MRTSAKEREDRKSSQREIIGMRMKQRGGRRKKQRGGRRKDEKTEWGKEVRIYALINSYFTFLNLSSN